ncbi:MAG: hypothetical protein DDT19_00557 [Syntrophomonadaceae bacterium]|nr:hypothetical protein [Bacillota bacterium]
MYINIIDKILKSHILALPSLKETIEDAEACDVEFWRCTKCGRIGTVGRCCGENTREPAFMKKWDVPQTPSR